MKLPILDLIDYDSSEQFEKVLEEFKEFEETEPTKTCSDLELQIFEGIDVIQAMLGYLTMILDIEDLEKYFEKHYQKLIDRNWQTDGHIELKFHCK